MSKYIDAERLKAEIEKRKQVHFDDYFIKNSGNPADYGASNALAQVLTLIDSLQQDSILAEFMEKAIEIGKKYNYGFGPNLPQPKIDLEKEIEIYFKGWYMDETDQGYILRTPDDHAGLMSVKQVARHFYELGLRRAAEMYDEIEYNRQRAEEECINSK